MNMGVCQAKKAVLRGGSWINNGRNLRSAYRNNDHRDNANDNNGFRLARAQVAAGGRNRTRQHPVMPGCDPSCKQQGRRGVSNHRESSPVGRLVCEPGQMAGGAR